MFADWGTLNPGFFVGTGIIMDLFGLIIVIISWLGCIGIDHQDKKDGFLTGRVILGMYQIILIVALVAEAWVLSLALSAIKVLTATFYDLQTGTQAFVPYSDFEKQMASTFNTFFFGAASKCQDVKFQWFWLWIQDNCPQDKISIKLCARCGENSVAPCYADETACYGDTSGTQQACAYTVCRVGILDFFVSNAKSLSYGILAFTLFQCVMMILNGMLVCYTKRDSVKEILYKTGTISNINRVPGVPTTHQNSQAIQGGEEDIAAENDVMVEEMPRQSSNRTAKNSHRYDQV